MALKLSTSTLRRVFFVITPILVLAWDFISFPCIFQNRPITKTVNLTSLLTAGRLQLGVFERHEIHVSVDDLESQDFLQGIAASRNALIISAFKEGHELSLAALGDAVMKKLNKVSPSDQHFIEAYLDGAHVRTGSVLRIELHVPQPNRAFFPIDELYVAVFEAGGPIESDELGSAIPLALKLGAQHNVANLILPCLGQDWRHPNDSDSLSFGEFFAVVFQSITPDTGTPAIHLSLYRQWPTFELEEAVGQFNSSWGDAVFPKTTGTRNTFYRSQFRMLMLFCALCLTVCSFLIEPQIKSFLIISVSYLGIALGSDTIVNFLTEGRPSLTPWIHVATLFILAAAFPIVIVWAPKDLFVKKDK